MSALLRVSFHFQAEEFQDFSGGGSFASGPWEHRGVPLPCWKAVCVMLGVPCTGGGSAPQCTEFRPPREGVEGAVRDSMS